MRGTLVSEHYKPEQVEWKPSEERWSLRAFPKLPGKVVYHLPNQLVMPISDRTVKKLHLSEGALLDVNSLGWVVSINGRKVRFPLWKMIFGSRLEPTRWEDSPNKRERLLSFGNNPTANVLTAIYPVPVGSVALFVGSTGSRKTTWLHHLLGGLVRTPNMVVMLLLVGERTHEVHAPENVELWALTTREAAEDSYRFSHLALDVARQRAVSGQQVVLFVDSIYRLAVIENIFGVSKVSATSGGAKSDVLYSFRSSALAVAGCVVGGGSLTIIGTNLLEESNALSNVLADTFEGTVDVHICLKPGGDTPDWKGGLWRKLENVPCVDNSAVWRLQDLMKKRMQVHLDKLISSERSARNLRGDRRSLDKLEMDSLREKAENLAVADFKTLVEQLGNEPPQIIWARADEVLNGRPIPVSEPAATVAGDAAEASKPIPAEPEQQLTQPSDEEIRRIAQSFSGRPVPQKPTPATVSPVSAWDKALAALSSEKTTSS